MDLAAAVESSRSAVSVSISFRTMVDGGIVVGYLTAAVLGAGRRAGDRVLDDLLERLYLVVRRRLGSEVIDRLGNDPGNQAVENGVRAAVEQVSRVDPDLTRSVNEIVAELDRRGGRQLLINQVRARTNVQSFGSGIAVGRDFNHLYMPDPTDYSNAPFWVKLFTIVGFLIALGGMGIFGYTLFTQMPDLDDPNFNQVPPGIPLAFGVFFVGLVLVMLGGLGRVMSRRR